MSNLACISSDDLISVIGGQSAPKAPARNRGVIAPKLGQRGGVGNGYRIVPAKDVPGGDPWAGNDPWLHGPMLR